jgi:hypothetical protein
VTKEEIHDEQIGPLVSAIIAICNKHGIAMVASFELGPDQLRCTTHLPDETGATPYARAVSVIRHGHGPPMMLTERDADGKVKSMTAIVG